MTSGQESDFSSFVVLNGKRLAIHQHPTDFTVQANKTTLESDENNYANVTQIARGISRASASNESELPPLISRVRTNAIAENIYVVNETGEELITTDRIILTLSNKGTGELEQIMEEYQLEYVRPMGGGHVLRVTLSTVGDPIEIANRIADSHSVVSCSPEIMQQIQYHQLPELFDQQWYLTTDLISHPFVVNNASAEVPEAWTITKGNRDVVVAVIDDGFDVQHPVFSGTRIHPDNVSFVRFDSGPEPEIGDFHGTPVASIILGSHTNQAIRGIAPDCTFLPVQIPFGRQEEFVSSTDMLDVFKFVSERADVVNCSFGFPPSSFQILPPEFRNEINEMTRIGGRRGKGLVIVFSAGNDDAPTFLAASQNVNGVKFLRGVNPLRIGSIPPNTDVFTGYPLIPGIVVVAAMSSTTRKSGYSNWGSNITVTAPSSNGHELNRRDPNFTANQRGLGQIAASNRPGQGTPSNPLTDNPITIVNESLYTGSFGGTSGAAPVVAGIAALMISVNPELTAEQVSQILQTTADKDLDVTLDLNNDPNLQGLSGNFVNGRSRFFGAGKVNATRAVRRANSLFDNPGSGVRFGQITSNEPIPDANPQGIVSQINITGEGPVDAIEVEVNITHTYRGDLHISLTSPDGFVAVLHNMEGGSQEDLRRVYTPLNSQDLQNFVTGRVAGAGRWILNVKDNLRRDVGVLNFWRLDLRGT